ncbi:MAG: DUF2993 domain-containing protein [Leptolyngbya sp. SIO4C1]|nr:DUF2993 domain-containing protein [Leptolyngbya sp. SIO4C1]
MELISILLSSLLFIGSPVGVILDQVAEDAIRDRLVKVEDIDVRVDNASAFQLLRGKVDKLRIGARGVYPVPDFRIAIADLETDAIDLDFGQLQRGQVALDQPLNSALHVVITPADLNAFLQSPAFTERLNQIPVNLSNPAQSREFSRYRLTNPQAVFLPNNRLRLSLDLADQFSAEVLEIEAETGLAIEAGHRLALLDPTVLVNGEAAPPQLLDTFTRNLGDRLSLRRLESAGVTLRVLAVSIEPDAFDLALWAQIDPSFTR